MILEWGTGKREKMFPTILKMLRCSEEGLRRDESRRKI